jgi:hypothetical protein
MGNSITKENLIIIKENINNIINYKCPILDLDNNIGHSDYIDFITDNDLGTNNIMKGIDIYQRPFIVIRAEYGFQDGSSIKTFSTFFKRYNDYDSILWHCCGHGGLNLMLTDGGMNTEQFEFLDELLCLKQINLTKEIIYKCNLLVYPNFNNFNNNNNIDETKIPILIKILE